MDYSSRLLRSAAIIRRGGNFRFQIRMWLVLQATSMLLTAFGLSLDQSVLEGSILDRRSLLEANRTAIEECIRSIENASIYAARHDFSYKDDHQFRLLRFLLDRHASEKLARPVRHGKGTLNVTFKMSLYQIVNVDEPSESVAINVWIEQIWKDEMIAWDPADYGNLSSMVIPVFSVWMPDTYLYNGISRLVMKREDSERLSNMEVFMDMADDPNRAKVVFRHPTIYTFSCKMNVRYFPFDTQNCSLVFGSWVHDASFIDYFSPENVDLAPYVQNEEWLIVSFNSYRFVTKYQCCPHPYTNIQFHLVMKRRPLYVLVNLVIPILLITLVSLIGFFSPDSIQSERSEKVTLGINTLLAMSVMLLMVTDKMPTTSNFVPLMGVFFLMQIILISVATVATTFVILLQRNNRSGLPVPKFWRPILFRFVACIVGIDASLALVRQSRKLSKRIARNRLKSRPSLGIDVQRFEENAAGEGPSALVKLRTPLSLLRGKRGKKASISVSLINHAEEQSQKVRRTLTQSLHEKLDEVSNTIKSVEHDLLNVGRRNLTAKLALYRFEWDLAATIVEKFLLYLFIAILCLGTAVMLSIGWLDQQHYGQPP